MSEATDYSQQSKFFSYEELKRHGEENFSFETSSMQLRKVFDYFKLAYGDTYIGSNQAVIPMTDIIIMLHYEFIKVIDLPNATVYLEIFKHASQKNVVRVGSIAPCYIYKFSDYKELLGNVFAAVSHLILVKPVVFRQFEPWLDCTHYALRHINIQMENCNELVNFLGRADHLVSLIVHVAQPVALSIFETHAPKSLAHLCIESDVRNTVEDNVTEIASVQYLQLKRLSEQFDFTFLPASSTKFAELALNSADAIPFDAIDHVLNRSFSSLQILDLSRTNLLTDHLLNSIIELRCVFIRVLRADQPRRPIGGDLLEGNAVGFSLRALKEFLKSPSAERLEILTLQGHTNINNTLFDVKYACIRALIRLDLRNTGCSSDDGIENLRMQKARSLAFLSRFPAIDPPTLIVYMNGAAVPVPGPNVPFPLQPAEHEAGEPTFADASADVLQLIWNSAQEITSHVDKTSQITQFDRFVVALKRQISAMLKPDHEHPESPPGSPTEKKLLDEKLADYRSTLAATRCQFAGYSLDKSTPNGVPAEHEAVHTQKTEPGTSTDDLKDVLDDDADDHAGGDTKIFESKGSIIPNEVVEKDVNSGADSGKTNECLSSKIQRGESDKDTDSGKDTEEANSSSPKEVIDKDNAKEDKCRKLLLINKKAKK
jgi:hypothetical protein